MQDKEKIEVRIIDGVQLLFYKNEALPFLVKTVVIQEVDINTPNEECLVKATFIANLK